MGASDCNSGKHQIFCYLKNPLMSPVGPILVWNIKLNSMGSLKSFPVIGDFMSNSLKTAAISPLDIPKSNVSCIRLVMMKKFNEVLAISA